MIVSETMMNLPQELGCYINNNHGPVSTSADEFNLYNNDDGNNSSTPSTTNHNQQQVEIQQHLQQQSSSIINICGNNNTSSQQSANDDDLNFYNNSVVTHSITSSTLPQLVVPYNIESESESVPSSSLYGLVTSTPILTSETNASAYPHSQEESLEGERSSSVLIVSSNNNHINHNGATMNNTHHHHRTSTNASSSHHSYSQPILIPHHHHRIDNSSSYSPQHIHTSHHHQQTTKNYHPQHYPHQSHHKGTTSIRKRKLMPMVDSDAGDDDSDTCSSSRRTTTPTDESSKKQNHSEIEKRRRDKMNTYITELSGMVPMCSAMSRKLDKLTVLRMAVQHMKTLRGSRVNSYTEGHYKPSFLTDEELKHLILQSAEGFLFVVGCDRGRLLYVSESVSQILNFKQSDLLGQSWFDILHPKDVAKVKEQLSSSDLSPRERLIDAKTMLPVKGNVPQQKANRLCPGARRSFFCRMKCKSQPLIKQEELDSSSGCQQQRRKKSSSSAAERKFSVIHCTGYLKSWAKVGMDDNEGETEDHCNLSCLVAVGRTLQPITSPSSSSKHRAITFISRHAIDGKFVFVDQRTTLVVGFLPQELLGTSMYEYFHHDDITSLAEVHKAVLVSNESITTQMYRFKTRTGDCIRLQSTWKAFRNPWTRDIECIVAKNSLPSMEGTTDSTSQHQLKEEEFTNAASSATFDFFPGTGGNTMEGGEIQRLINSEVSFRKIGEQIAEDVVESQRRNDSSSSNSPVSVLESTTLCSSSMTTTDLRPIPTTMLSPSPIHHHGGGSGTSNFLHLTSQSPQQQIASRTTSPDSSTGLGGGEGNQAVTSSNETEDLVELMNLSTRSNDPIIGSPNTIVNVPTGSNSDNTIRTTTTRKIEINTLRNTSNETDEEMLYIIADAVLPESPHLVTPSGIADGNDEAAMAVIMSLLEADAGLGGPVDFSGLPWPLP